MNYKGKITTSGSSEAIRFEKELFKQNPEFKQQAEVRADIIGPGKMLISVVDRLEIEQGEDPSDQRDERSYTRRERDKRYTSWA